MVIFVRIKIIAAALSNIVESRAVTATLLAGSALALALLGTIGANSTNGMQLGHGSLAASHFAGLSASHLPGLVALGLAVGAFIVSWGNKSYLVAGLLIATGILYSLHLAPFLGNHSVIAFPGPIVGLFIGHVILALGIVIAVASVGARLVRNATE